MTIRSERLYKNTSEMQSEGRESEINISMTEILRVLLKDRYKREEELMCAT